MILTILFVKKKPFQRAEQLRGQHIKALDNVFKAQLDKYYQHPQLTTYVAFLDSKEAWSIYKADNRFPANWEESIHRSLAQLDTTLERLDERGLSLQKILNSQIIDLKGDILFLDEDKRVCNEYHKLLLEFLKNPARAGQHALNGARFATAAFCCLRHVSVVQTSR